VHLGTEGRLTELTDGVDGEVVGAGASPGRGVVEGLVEVVRERGRGGVPRGGGLMEGAAASGDKGGTAWEGAGAERQPYSLSSSSAASNRRFASACSARARSCRWAFSARYASTSSNVRATPSLDV